MRVYLELRYKSITSQFHFMDQTCSLLQCLLHTQFLEVWYLYLYTTSLTSSETFGSVSRFTLLSILANHRVNRVSVCEYKFSQSASSLERVWRLSNLNKRIVGARSSPCPTTYLIQVLRNRRRKKF